MTRRIIAITFPLFAIVGAVVAWSVDKDGGPMAFVIIFVGIGLVMWMAAESLKPPK